jgi:hypothetical protein
MDIKEEIKILLLKEKSTITELAKELSIISGKKYTQASLSQKLTRDTLRASEYRLILDILGYKINIGKDNNPQP